MSPTTLIQCVENSEFIHLKFDGFRCVEDQTQSVTLNLVDSINEHDILEQEIEGIKPSVPKACNKFHYLLFTPFRYKPARWGSRFGAVTEQSMFYGSLEEKTSLAETAYYQLRFFERSKGNFHVVTKGFCVFSVPISTARGLDLTIPAFNKHRSSLTSVHTYSATQKIGSIMRKRGVEAFTFWSARIHGKNFALFSFQAFAKTSPKSQRHWEASVARERVIFSRHTNKEAHEFRLEDFFFEGKFPTLPS
jgi:hypothetical protein